MKAMPFLTAILMHAFGRPRGLLGRLGGLMMARTNAPCAAWVVTLLKIQPEDRVLEVGFGPGVAIQLMTRLTPVSFVAGVDASQEMVAQAAARNRQDIESGRVQLQQGAADSLLFENNSFDKTVAINSMQVWPNVMAGLREMQRVLKTGGKITLGFTPYSGQSKDGVPELLANAGFENVHLVESDKGFCILALKP
jgi:ubiquinone/menaquinone biosynthesis C-methylase UbiE